MMCRFASGDGRTLPLKQSWAKKRWGKSRSTRENLKNLFRSGAFSNCDSSRCKRSHLSRHRNRAIEGFVFFEHARHGVMVRSSTLVNSTVLPESHLGSYLRILPFKTCARTRFHGESCPRIILPIQSSPPDYGKHTERKGSTVASPMQQHMQESNFLFLHTFFFWQ